MKLIESVQQLINEGYNIDFRVRTDGGIIVTSINGQHFRGAEGNKVVRSLTGAKLSSARQKQLEYNVKKYISGKKKPRVKFPEDLKKKVRLIQKIWRKNKLSGSRKISVPKARWYYTHYGRKGLQEYLSNAARYGLGLAYIDNVRYLVERMQRVAQNVENGAKLYYLASKIWEKRYIFPENLVSKIYQSLYEFENTQNEALIQTIGNLINTI